MGLLVMWGLTLAAITAINAVAMRDQLAELLVPVPVKEDPDAETKRHG